MNRLNKKIWIFSFVMSLFTLVTNDAQAQFEQLDIQYGSGLPEEVTSIYEKGTKFLQTNQNKDGSFGNRQDAAAVTGLAVMAFLSTGENPNFGSYSSNIRRAVRFIIKKQNSSGFIGPTMYNHGFAMLALSEAYGAVDEDLLWEGTKTERARVSIGKTIEKAVQLAVTSQKRNHVKAWHYSPVSTSSADTSVAGAVLMGLLAARNAGIEVPNESIDKALGYFKSMTEPKSGIVAYSNFGSLGDSNARSAIAALVFAIGKRKDLAEFKGASKSVADSSEQSFGNQHPFYTQYYRAQALFQSDYAMWEKWNRNTIRTLQDTQLESGQIGKSPHGPAYSTSMSLLALALNYRFLPIYER